jgi:hypothetical protein
MILCKVNFENLEEKRRDLVFSIFLRYRRKKSRASTILEISKSCFLGYLLMVLGHTRGPNLGLLITLQFLTKKMVKMDNIFGFSAKKYVGLIIVTKC